MRSICGVVCVLLGTAGVWGQSAAPASHEFEVASIRPSAPLVPGELGLGMHIDGAQISGRFWSLKDYLGMAYKLKNYQITGPDWISSERFDIAAKLPEGAERAQVPEMLQALLTNRFQIKSHRDTKEEAVYGLLVAKGGLKMQPLPESEEDSEPSNGVDVAASGSRGGVSVNLGKGSSFTFGDNKVVGKKLKMITLADVLSRFVDRPVVDMTELKGSYDFTLDINPDDFRGMMIRSAVAAGVTLPPQALQLLDGASDAGLVAALRVVGLTLEPRKAPIEIMVIDHAEKAPTEN